MQSHTGVHLASSCCIPLLHHPHTPSMASTLQPLTMATAVWPPPQCTVPRCMVTHHVPQYATSLSMCRGVPPHSNCTTPRHVATTMTRFGVGRLVRELNLTLVENYYTPRVAVASVPDTLHVESWPDRPMRGIQIGYRPKTNS